MTQALQSRLAAWRWPVAAAIAGLAVFLLWRQLRAIDPVELRLAWRATPVWAIVGSLLATAASFACLGAYERLATQWIAPGRVPARTAWSVGLAAHAIANTLGFHPLTGGALRLQRYRALGLGAREVMRIVALVGACVGAGVAVTGVTALLGTQAGAEGQALRITALLLVFAGIAWLFLAWWPGGRDTGGTTPSAAPPPVRGAAMGLVIALLGLLEMGGAIGALYLLLPDGTAAPAWFALAYLLAMLAGLASHAPGGIGVFEASLMLALPTDHAAGVLAALLAYRVIYNLLPFLVAVTLLGIRAAGPARELRQFEGG